MSSLFRRTLAALLVIVLLLVIVVAAGLFSGYNRSLTAWSSRRHHTVEAVVREILVEHRRNGTGDAGELRVAAETLPADVPVFVFDRNRELLVSNRGLGRRRDTESMPSQTVRDEATGAILGYYAMGTAQFHLDAANRALLQALVRAAVTTLMAGMVLAAGVAALLARYLSRPAARVAAGIDRIATGETDVRVPEVGAREISGIARSANMLARRLEEEQQIRAQWVQDVAHDLRSPVATIKVQLEAIADGVYHADATRINRLLTELGRTEQLINDLDDLMRLEAPEMRPACRRFPAAGFLEDLRERFADTAAERKISLKSTSHRECEFLYGDENLLYRAVSNLISNAVRHAAEHGNVGCEVAPGAGGSNVSITVWNDGPPIPPEELSRVFDRLYRGEYARKTPGSGLGLTIARRIAEIHGGTIQMERARETGTTVRITIPTDPAGTADPQGASGSGR